MVGKRTLADQALSVGEGGGCHGCNMRRRLPLASTCLQPKPVNVMPPRNKPAPRLRARGSWRKRLRGYSRESESHLSWCQPFCTNEFDRPLLKLPSGRFAGARERECPPT